MDEINALTERMRKMELFEKVEKLSEKANVSYEDAKNALEACNGDILDAMIMLEKEGKTETPKKESFSTKPEEDKQLPEVVDVKDEEENNNKEDHELTRKFKAIWRKISENFLIISRKEERILKVPVWLFILIVLIGWQIVPFIIVISLFFGCHYTFEGIDEMKTANSAMNKADEVVEHIKDEYKKL